MLKNKYLLSSIKDLIKRIIKLNNKNSFTSKVYNLYAEKKMLNNRFRALKCCYKLKNIYFLLDQNHGNLGDQAIGYAEAKFIKDNLSEYNVFSILENEYEQYKNYFKKIIKKGDIICLRGGGSIGNEYIRHECNRRDIINTFTNNKIISFPQTMYFSNDEYGRNELQKTVDVYNKHQNLTIIAREKTSYELMKKSFINNQVILTPDIVLYLTKTEPKLKREGALFCFRSDKESILSLEKKEGIISLVNKYFDSVFITDMCINRNVNIDEREKELEAKLNQFKSVEIVITDRLHGMIFSVITATPCIAINNYNHKLRDTYEWIKQFNFIKFANNYDELHCYIKELKHLQNYTYSNDFTIPYYKQIIKVLRNNG